MMIAEIPETVLNWFRQLGELNEGEFEALMAAVKSAPVAEDFASASRHLRLAVPRAQAGFVDECLSALIMGESLANQLRMDGHAFARLIAERVALMHGSESISKASLVAAERLGALLAQSTSLNLLVKAYDISSEVPRRLSRSRILTDVRPVFGDDATGRPSAAVIMHTLALSYYEGSELRHLHINCDASSLRDLQDVAQRASEKQRTLEGVLGDRNLRVLSGLSFGVRSRS